MGTFLLLDRDTNEVERVGKRMSEKVLALIGLGISISPDELVAGFALGLARIPVTAGFVAIAIQGIVASQLGLFLGSRLGARFHETAGRLAAIGLVVIGVYQLAEQVTS